MRTKKETISDTLASVLKTEPPWDALPPATPPSMRRVLRSCLEKDPKRRLQAIGDWRLLLEDGPQSVTVAKRKLPWVLAVATSAVLAGALLALGLVHFQETPLQPRTARFQVPLPEKTTNSIFHLSPDGRTLAITAIEGGQSRLWVRSLDSLDARALPGTEGALYPFWSPDGAFIGFFAQGKLKKIALTGGLPQTLCDAPDGRGGTWNGDGVIVFSPGLGLALSRVPAAGGVAAPVTKPANSEELHRFPEFLPGGQRFLYLITRSKPETDGLHVGSLDGTPPVRILPDESSAVYAPSDASGKTGYLLFRRGATLMAQPFDPGRIRMTGEMFPLAEEVSISVSTNNAAFSVSENGVLAYRSGPAAAQGELAWKDRTGKRLDPIGQSGARTAALSPDEKRILFSINKPAGGSDLWLHDVARGVPSRLTFRPGTSTDGVWSPDGSRIVFQADTDSLYQKPANGTGNEELLFRGGAPIYPLDWSRDGKFLVFQIQSRGQAVGHDLWLLPVEGDRKPVPYLQSSFSEGAAQFSPDGRWMAYASNESGQPQIYVQAIPASGTKWQISTMGGDQPRWRRDGKELFYISADQKLMAVSVKTGTVFETGSPQPLFEIEPLYATFQAALLTSPRQTASGFW